jgi:prepilin-type N-terminal cleavage/methylation domain-containing protein
MKSKKQAGFTLVELAVVVLLASLLLTMGITTLKAQLAQGALSATKKKQEIIKDALVTYVSKYKRLPCPAINISGGLDATTRVTTLPPPNCITNLGLVPYQELGLPLSAALDGWENYFTYAVSPQWTATLTNTAAINGGNYSNNPLNTFNVGGTGALTVNTRRPASLNPPIKIADPAATPNSGAAVVLISHGINGDSSYASKGTQNIAPPAANPDELKNALPQNLTPPTITTQLWISGTTEFFDRDYTEQDAGYGTFDDIVSFYTPQDLIKPLIKDGVLQSADGSYANMLVDIRNYVIGQIATTCAVPITLPAQFTNDPWGNPLAYVAFPTNKYVYTPTVSPNLTTANALTFTNKAITADISIYKIIAVRTFN